MTNNEQFNPELVVDTLKDMMDVEGAEAVAEQLEKYNNDERVKIIDEMAKRGLLEVEKDEVEVEIKVEEDTSNG